ncbi:hypothetical protein BJ875DRAFT_50420 [Amylocarpus encephaloides]|uniref:mRNA N(6)-methyladenine demethylase n=1 Tax=Amylocarpus encephaloides TaxID=45428 RepID=A0A9P7YGK6_9HELO|nr:hypothetical protein BJ875DRAFT_50420 [Amylocarpus encephaloides]
MDEQDSGPANALDGLGNDLDPYKAAPQDLKDLWKQWTKAKSPYEVPTLSLIPAGIQISEDLLQREFTAFALDHLYSLFANDSQGLQGFLASLHSSNPAAVLSLEDVNIPKSPNQKVCSKAEFMTIADAKLVPELTKAWRHSKCDHTPYEVVEIPGLVILPNLLPSLVQQTLLDLMLHREFSRPQNQTNFHLNYNLSYPEDGESFFSIAPESAFSPKTPAEHKPMSIQSALEKNLHWITLGGQYDWTNKVYPPEKPPKFPDDLTKLIKNIFTDIKPEAAIINVYSAKDKLSMHRDVSEEADRGLVSISLGCACIFIIGIEDKITGKLYHETLRLNSGDAIYMAGASRYAWHGVPKIIPDSCPDYLQYWPGKSYPAWEGWMNKKRVNLNIRQMYEEKTS